MYVYKFTEDSSINQGMWIKTVRFGEHRGMAKSLFTSHKNNQDTRQLPRQSDL